jgi:hypothetical protein
MTASGPMLWVFAAESLRLVDQRRRWPSCCTMTTVPRGFVVQVRAAVWGTDGLLAGKIQRLFCQ